MLTIHNELPESIRTNLSSRGASSTPLKRIAVELASPEGAHPPFIAEHLLYEIEDVVERTTSIIAVDLGVQATPTGHPSFLRFAKSIAALMRARGGLLIVWVDADTNRIALSTLAQQMRPLIVLPLPGVSPESVADLRKVPEILYFDQTVQERYGLGISPAGRPDAPAPRSAESPLGGCPIVEQPALFIGVEGGKFACQRHMRMNEALDESKGPALDATGVIRWEKMRHVLRLDRRAEASKPCATCNMSFRGWIDDAQLRAFWRQIDDLSGITDIAERKHIFGTAVPTPQRVVKVDLGCGPVKRDGFVGIDRFPMPGVDIVTDLNEGIPLEDDSVDYLIASHSLEHFDDLPKVIQEIHRICKDRALVTIVAPYSATGLNLANPYHVQVFNEHTARFFTNAAESALEQADYDFPAAPNWGLASSDHSNWQADLRLLKCEFHYMPPYRGLTDDAKRVLRKSLNDVVEQIVLQMLVVKSPISPQEFSELARDTDYQEPPYVTARRHAEAHPGPSNPFVDLVELPSIIADLRLEGDRVREKAETGLSQQGDRLGELETSLRDAQAQMQAERTSVATRITAVNTQLVKRYIEQNKKLDELQKALAQLKEEMATKAEPVPSESTAAPHVAVEPAATVLTAQDETVNADHRRIVRKLQLREHGDPLRRHARAYARRSQDLAPLIAPSFAAIKQFGLAHGWSGDEGFRLQESELWQDGQEWIYDLPVTEGELHGIEFAITTMFPSPMLRPVFGCAVWSADSSTLLAGGHVMINGDTSLEPLAARFAPVSVSNGMVRIRLVALPTVEWSGVRTLEWRRLTSLRQVREMRLFCRPLYA
jgi:SAM-dependent methyltransferase